MIMVIEMIKNYIINKLMNIIENNNKYEKEQLESIKYGLESIYLLLTKFIVILCLSIILKIFKETLILLLLYNFLRAFAFGLHATKSIYCWIASLICFIIIPFICKYITFPTLFFIITSIITFICFILYSPADTKKRPLINKKKRKRFKILSIILSFIYIILIYIIKNPILKNTLAFSLILETILILPITYKLFKLPYNNYLNYK